MPRFINTKDLAFFNQVSKELVEDVIETPVVLYKISVADSKTNLYGESLTKTYYPGIKLYALIDRENEVANYDGAGPDTSQTATFRFQRTRLETLGEYPEEGEILDWNNAYWEISNVIENQLPGGRVNQNFSFVAEAFMIRRSQLNIEERAR